MDKHTRTGVFGDSLYNLVFYYFMHSTVLYYLFHFPRYAIGSVERNGSIGWLHTLGDQLGKHYNDSIQGIKNKNIAVIIQYRFALTCNGVQILGLSINSTSMLNKIYAHLFGTAVESVVAFTTLCKSARQVQDHPSKTSTSPLCTSPSAV